MKPARMHRLLLPLLLLLSTGCPKASPPQTSGGPPPSPGRAPVRVVSDLGDTRVRAQPDALLGTATYDAQDLFDRGLALLEQGEVTLARIAFARVVAEFPSSPLSVAARYNQALAAERQGRDADAAALYGEYIRVAEGKSPVEAAQLRLLQGRLYFGADLWIDALLPLQKALASGHLDQPGEWEARALSARIRGRGKEWRVAEGELASLRREIKRATRATGERFAWHSAMVWFHAGGLYRDRAEATHLLDVDDLTAARAWLGDVASWFLESRRCYKRVLEHRQIEWSGPASVALGRINEDFRGAMLAADTPSSLDADGTAVYLQLLQDQTRSFLEKAVEDYRWLLRDARDLRIEGPWIEELRGALGRVERQLGQSGQATVSIQPTP